MPISTKKRGALGDQERGLFSWCCAFPSESLERLAVRWTGPRSGPCLRCEMRVRKDVADGLGARCCCGVQRVAPPPPRRRRTVLQGWAPCGTVLPRDVRDERGSSLPAALAASVPHGDPPWRQPGTGTRRCGSLNTYFKGSAQRHSSLG